MTDGNEGEVIPGSEIHEARIKRLEVVLIFCLAFLVLLPLSLARVNVHDEGLIVAGADLVRHGQMPYRDFISFYGPAQYYLIAILYAVFGADLLVSRLLHAFTMACMVVLVFSLSVKACANRSRWISYVTALICTSFLLASSPNANYPSLPASVFLLVAAFFYGRWCANLAVRDLVISSCLVAVAGLFRWDFGVFGLLSMGGATAFILVLRGRAWMDSCRTVAASVLPAGLIMSSIYFPLLALSDPSRWYREILYYSLFDFPKYRGIEYLRPALHQIIGSLYTHNAIQFCSGSIKLIFVFLPSVLPFVALAGAAYALRRTISDIQVTRPLVQSVFISLLCLLLLNQMRVRPTLWQGLPATIAALALIPYIMACFEWRTLPNYKRKLVIVTGTAILLAVATAGTTMAVDSFSRCMNKRNFITLSVPKATGIKVQLERHYYSDLISYIVSKTRPGEKIYSGVIDHSRIYINDSLIYFLSGRQPANRFLELDPGLASTAPSQKEIIRSLDESRVRLIVLLSIENKELNLASESNNVRLLDSYIRSNYEMTRDFGPYVVYEKR
jgi:hypothetical protein